ncbi:Unknown protein, partial [Striga hermonthica]
GLVTLQVTALCSPEEKVDFSGTTIQEGAQIHSWQSFGLETTNQKESILLASRWAIREAKRMGWKKAQCILQDEDIITKLNSLRVSVPYTSHVVLKTDFMLCSFSVRSVILSIHMPHLSVSIWLCIIRRCFRVPFVRIPKFSKPLNPLTSTWLLEVFSARFFRTSSYTRPALFLYLIMTSLNRVCNYSMFRGKFLLSFSYAPAAEIDGFREFSGHHSDWAVVAPKPEDDFRRPPKGCFTFFVDQIMSGLRFPIQPELQSLSNLFDIPINQFTPNSIRIMVAFIVVTHIVLGNFLPEFFLYCYGYRFSKDAHCLGRRVGVTFLDDLSSNITEWKKKYFFILPAPGQYPFSNEWITNKTKQHKRPDSSQFADMLEELNRHVWSARRLTKDTSLLNHVGICVDKSAPQDIELIYIDEPVFHKSLCIGSHLQEPLRSELISFLKHNSDVFAWKHEDMKGIDPGVASHKLNLDQTIRPVVQKRRKLRPDRQKALEEEVEKLIDNKFIKEAKYPTWVLNPVLVKKSNELWRLCIDFSDLNKACPKDSYPLPHIDYMVDATSGHELMSFMDAYSGYNQIPMDPEDSEHTSFYSARGLYCYTMMPFGLKNAGATYQRLVNKMFATMIGHTMEVYVNDMLVKSVHASDHVAHLQDMFNVLRSYSIVLNPKKCTFGVKSGKFLGYMVSQRGIEANPAKIKAIRDLTLPTSVKGVQALTGRLAALNRFISKSIDRCRPFFEAIKKGKRFEWTEECQRALVNIKETLVSPPTLQKPKPEEMLFLYLGVSDSAISAVLIREEGLLQSPIYYVSKALHDAELRYPPMEKLTFALVVAARKLRPYFQEHSITVRTSYPLRQILHRPDTSGRMIKWAIELGQFDIHYQPRTAIKAQALSDFIAEFTPAITVHHDNQPWVLYIDGSSTANRAGAGIVLADPDNRLF